MDEVVNPGTAARSLPASGMMLVGIGASAGGIQALQAFFENVPADSGIAYVVILHLSPDHESLLPQVLQSIAAIPVSKVTGRMRVEANHAYVIPPDHHLMMQDGHIVLEKNISLAERRAPVDIFFRTLAESHGPNAVCVILSGTGADGSMGLKVVKEAGGAAFAQDPSEAEWDEMPRSAIGTGMIDDILPVAKIPAKIIGYRQNMGAVAIPLEAESRLPDDQQALRDLFLLLRARTGHDFSLYKRATLLRRIERRIHVHTLPDIASYIRVLREDPQEAPALLKDLLISVTHFFRDPLAFKYVESAVLPQIFAGKSGKDAVRIWVVGCATGEEAYSVAILCAEATLGILDGPKVQIFATDIDRGALSRAREAVYTLSDAAEVLPERLHRYFSKDAHGYIVRREVREMILFANHNVLHDPPFSHIDLIMCRNVMIYLEPQAQERVLATAHFALNPDGYLLLGTSESVNDTHDLFSTVARQPHVFQRRPASMRRYPMIADKITDLQTRVQWRLPAGNGPRQTASRGPFGDLHQKFLERYAPPSLIVNEDYEVVHLSERAGRYLQIAGGEPSNNLLQVIRPEMRLELRTALYQATSRKTNVEVRNLKVALDNETETVNIHVRPVPGLTDSSRGFLLVIFEPSAAPVTDEERLFSSDEPMVQQLEDELSHLKLELRATNEAHEIQAEELKASNEELQAMNEELRSAGEELETSREELQSINEELTTVNQELKVKIDEASQTSNNLLNLVNSTDVATIFLDRLGHVHLFSPAVRKIFNLLDTDIGRPLTDITTRLESGTDLSADAARVLENLNSIEREVRTTDGNIFLMRLLPYRTAEERIQGVVATFTQITERKRAEEAIANDLKDTVRLRELGARLIRQGEAQPLYADIVAAAIELTGADAGIAQLLDAESHELVLLAAQGIEPDALERFRRVGAGDSTQMGTAMAANQRLAVHHDQAGDADGKAAESLPGGYVSVHATPLVERSGKSIGMLSTYWRTPHRPAERELRFLDLLARQAADFIEQRQSAEALVESQHRLQAIADLVPDLLWSSDAEGRTDWYNHGWFEFSGRKLETGTVDGWRDLIHPDDRNPSQQKLQQALTTGEPAQYEHRMRHAGGEFRWFIVHARPQKDEAGNTIRWFGAATDIHDLRRAHEALRVSEERLRLTVESVSDYAIFTTDIEGIIDSWNSGAERMFGFSEAEAIGQHTAIIFTPEDRAAGADKMEMRTAFDTGRASDERWHLRKDGTRFYVSGVMTALFSEGIITGYAKIARDLTEQKRAGDALREAHEELERKVQERTKELAAANASLREEIAERRRAEEARLGLLQQLVNAQEGERRRISRELHDQLGQQVSALTLKLAMMRRDESIDPKARTQLEALESITREIDGDLDFLVWELRPTALDDLGLREALSDYVDNWSKHFGIAAQIRDDGGKQPRLRLELETVLYRIAQEALNNISKHAQATHVELVLTRDEREVFFTIVDDGIGFDAVQPFETGAKGLGLVGMRERAALVGGSVEIESKTGGGTRIVVRIPLEPEPQKGRRSSGRKRDKGEE